MKEVQCDTCLQYAPLGYVAKGILLTYDKGTKNTKHTQKMYGCCADHFNELVNYYRSKADCTFIIVNK